MYLTQCLHRSLQQHPERIMTICGDRVRTTRQVVDRVSRLAAALHTLDVETGEAVGLLALNSDYYHEFYFGCWWAGAVAHPLNTRWSPVEMAYALNDSATGVLLVDDNFAALGAELRERAPGVHTLVYCGDGPTPDGMRRYDELIASHEPAPDVRRGDADTAFLLYTGGTTGTPKGVMVTHRGIITSATGSLVVNQSAQAGGVALVTAPLFHMGAILGWAGQAIVGGTHVYQPAFTPEGVLEAIEKHRVTSTTLVPLMVQALCNRPDFASYDTSTVQRISYGGAGSPTDTLRLAMKCFPNARFTQAYGGTEMGIVTVLTHEDHLDPGRLGSAGRGTPNTEVAVADLDGRLLPPGEVGEILTRGDQVMSGYWNKPQLTAETFRDGWLRTGDLGFLDKDGYLVVVDRLKDMIITGGENVYSAEVENVLATHPAVASCAVIGLPDDHWGERVHAVITLRPGHNASAEEIRAHAKTQIAGYKAPRTVEFVDAMPLSPVGKILKRDLRAERLDG